MPKSTTIVTGKTGTTSSTATGDLTAATSSSMSEDITSAPIISEVPPPMSLTLLKAKAIGSLKSWVMWLNTLIGMAIPALDYAQMSFPAAREFIPSKLYATGFVILIVTNMLLRFFQTRTSVEQK